MELIELAITTTKYKSFCYIHWGNFSKTSGRTTSDNSQKRFFGDKGMEFSLNS